MPTQKREQSCKCTEFPLKRMEGIPPIPALSQERGINAYMRKLKKGQKAFIWASCNLCHAQLHFTRIMYSKFHSDDLKTMVVV